MQQAVLKTFSGVEGHIRTRPWLVWISFRVNGETQGQNLCVYILTTTGHSKGLNSYFVCPYHFFYKCCLFFRFFKTYHSFHPPHSVSLFPKYLWFSDFQSPFFPVAFLAQRRTKGKFREILIIVVLILNWVRQEEERESKKTYRRKNAWYS